jgi:UDP:flavonoid glycosyltransferase YjiC (YdhE family)
MASNGEGSSGHADRKPRLLFCTIDASGHASPLLRIASQLATGGFDITFLTGKDFHESVVKFGGKPLAVQSLDPDIMAAYAKMPDGLEKAARGIDIVFIKSAPYHYKSLCDALEAMNNEDPTWPIVIVGDVPFSGTHPLYMGAPLPKGLTKRPPILGIHAISYLSDSQDAFPFGMGLAPDTSEEGRVKMEEARKMAKTGPFSLLVDAQTEVMQQLGAVDYKAPGSLFDTWANAHDIVLQMCPPSLEYPISDRHEKFRFAGAVTRLPAGPDEKASYPAFWDKVTSGERKLVVVTQGTVSIDYSQLIMPTLTALGGREDVFVVAILGIKGAALPEDFEVPANAHVIDYLAYDLILPYTSAFVNNAGYGGFIHGITNGVPMVMAGASEDKPDVAMRGEWAGVGINLRTGEPSAEQLSEAVDKVLEDSSFKDKVVSIQKENEQMNAIKKVEEAILELTSRQ